MIRHYLLFFLRNFTRAKTHFLINLIGLSTGLACTLLIFLWVRDEWTMDKFHAYDSRLFQVMEFQEYADEIMTTTSTPGLLAETLKEEIPEIEFAATTTWIGNFTLAEENKSEQVKAKGYYVGQDYFLIFSYPLIQGDARQVLLDKTSIVISRDLAIRLFGSVDGAVEKVIDFQREKVFKVTGVFENIPESSSYQFDFVLSFEVFKDDNVWVTQWGNNGPSTYVILREGTDSSLVSQKIAGFVAERNEKSTVTLFLKSYSERYLYGKYKDGVLVGGRIEYVQLFSIVALFILVIACINFMNLATARSSTRAKEVGIKKSIGVQKGSLILQYLSESLLTAFIALSIAVVLVKLALPQFNLITEKQITLGLGSIDIIVVFIAITFMTGILAGSYPALYLSRFNPSAVMKGEIRGSAGELWARKGLVIFQFLLSVILIASVLVINQQITFIQNTNLGYKKENLIRFPIEGTVKKSCEVFIEELKRIPGVINASRIGHNFVGRQNNTQGIQWEGKNPEESILFENISADFELVETLGVELVSGRPFSSEYSTDSSKIIFNEAAIRVMNMKDPIGKVIKLWNQYDLEIIGVAKNFHFQSLHDEVSPAFFRLSPKNTWNVMVRIEGGKEKETIKALESYYSSFNPGFTLDYKFIDQEYAAMYKTEGRVAILSAFFASFAILISTLGLLGLAAFTAQRRLKEIGIRKALGSSSSNIVYLLSIDFLQLVLISVLIGIPVSYYFLDGWLTRFAFHIELEWWFFAVTGTIAFLVAFSTVSYQALRAASINPVDCLRNE